MQTEPISQSTTQRPYPFVKRIPILDVFKSKDLYKAIAYFIGLQLVVVFISLDAMGDTFNGIYATTAVCLSAMLITLALQGMQKRYKQQVKIATNTIHPVRSVVEVFLIILVMLIALVLATFVYNLLGITMPTQPNQESLTALTTQLPIIMLFFMIIVAPIIEEYIFRELLPHTIGVSYISFIASSILFAVVHAPFGLMGWTSYMILTAGFLYARLYRNNIYYAIAVHMIWNLLSVLA